MRQHWPDPRRAQDQPFVISTPPQHGQPAAGQPAVMKQGCIARSARLSARPCPASPWRSLHVGAQLHNRRRAGIVCSAAAADSDGEEEDAAPGVPVRVERLLANLGYGKRRECAGWVKKGRVVFAGTGAAAKVGQKATAGDVLLDGQALDPPSPLVIALHKPTGYVVTSPDDENIPDPKVYDLLPYRYGRRRPFLSAVGRLDKDTSGLLLLTDDGQLLHRILSPRLGIWKRYRVVLDRPLEGKEAAGAVRRFASGAMQLVGDRGPLLPAGLTMVDATTGEVALCEGRYHQIRRMFALLGREVVSLHRHSIGGLTLGDLPEAEWRGVSPQDLTALFAGPQLDPAADAAAAASAPSSSSSAAAAAGWADDAERSSSSSSSRASGVRSAGSRDGASSGQGRLGARAAQRQPRGELLVVDGAGGDEDAAEEDGQQQTSKRYRDSARFKRRRAALRQRLPAAAAAAAAAEGDDG